jgi:hypothetical protein
VNTPEQGFIGLIKELRAMGVKYNALMAERKLADTADNGRSHESIDGEIDDLLDLTMATARLLIDDEPESPATEETTISKYTVIGFYDDTGLRFVSHREAESAAAAIGQVAETYPDDNISVCAVIAGEHNDLMEGDYLEDTDDLKGEGT